MKSFNISSLDDATVLRVLTLLPTFSALAAAVRSSKPFSKVYHANIKLVLAAVAYNVIGPALPHALRVVRCGVIDTEELEIGEQDEDEQVDAITLSEARQLAKDASVVAELENLFSLRYKNQKYKTSQLSTVEAWRFRKAMYRIMLYARVFPVNSAAYILTSEDAIDQDELRREQLARRKFLSKYPKNELLQLRLVSEFLKETIKWVDLADGADMTTFKDFGDISLSLGPSVVLECYKTIGLEPLIDAIDARTQVDHNDFLNDIRPRPMLSGYVEDPIKQILEERQVKPREGGHWSDELDCLLDQIENDDQCCENCDRSDSLWGEASWDHLSLISPVLGTTLFVDRLKGYLPRNPVDSQHAERALLNTPFEDIYHDIFRDGLKLSGYESWKEDGWVCTSCLMKFTTDHLHLWVNHWRRKAGEKISDDCWYGYGCRTQSHKQSHAQNLNHLCEPKQRR